MEIKNILEKLGLTSEQSAIYINLINHGPQRITDICKRTHLHRPAVYRHLPHLVEQHLVTTTPKGKQTLYVAESPDKLYSLVQTIETSLKEEMPDLISHFAMFGKRPTIKFLEGRAGITFALDDVVRTLKKGDTYYRYSSAKDMKHTDSYLSADYRRIRDSKQLERFIITSKSVAKFKKPKLERAMKIVPEKYGLFDFDIMQVVYTNKVAYVDYNTETALIIENQTIAAFQMKLFRMLFDLLPGNIS